MIKRIVVTLLVFFSLTFPIYGTPTPAISAEGAILMEPNTGEILYAKNIKEKFFPASTTKILTSLILIEDLSPNILLVKTQEAFTNVPSDSSHIGLAVGDTYSFNDGLHAILMASDNFVSYDMATKDSGNIESFIKKMNKKASSLGATSSNFVNPHGYHDENHYTTPYDLALIARAAFNNPILQKISGTYKYNFNIINRSKSLPLTHTAPLLDKSSKFYNPYVVGVKTGFHDAAKRTLVAKANYDNIELIAVIMKTTSPNQFVDINNLFEYGRENFSTTNLSSNTTILVNHSFSPWAKPYVDYALDNNWISSSTKNYSDPITKQVFIDLLTNAFPDELMPTIKNSILYPNSLASNSLLSITRLEANALLEDILNLIDFHPSINYELIDSPDNNLLTYEQAITITYRLKILYSCSIPNIFYH